VAAQKGVGLVFYFFDNPQQGHYFLTTNNEKLKDCVNASIIHMSDEIAFNNEKAVFIDYLNPEKVNVYPFESLPDKDFRI
jgi:Zn-finger protein